MSEYDKWTIYERRKAEFSMMALSDEDYLRRIRELCDELNL